MKFTFKTNKPIGKWISFYSDSHDIKLNNKRVGSIDDETPHKIRFMVKKKDINEDRNTNCPWKRITLKRESATLQEAKDFLNEHIESIMSKFELYPLD